MTNPTFTHTTTSDLRELARFINFHSHPHASFYNTIDGIIAPDANIEVDIALIMGLLEKDHLLLHYKIDSEVELFLGALTHALHHGKTVFIACETVDFHPVVFDQLMNFRQDNRFTFLMSDASEPETIHPDAKLFAVFRGVEQDDISKVYELADHVLDVTERRQ